MDFELKEFPKYGDLMTKEDWLDRVSIAGFIDYDGHGCLATETQQSNVIVVPSFVNRKIKEIKKVSLGLEDLWEGKTTLYDKSLDIFTHVMWFNR